MAMVYDGGLEQSMEIKSKDLLIQTDNGATIRVQVNKDSILICPINGVKMDIAPAIGGGAHGIKFEGRVPSLCSGHIERK
jgi:hypothetical protein